MRFFYLRNEQRFPVACVCSAIAQAHPERAQFTMSIFNPRDVFDKTRAKEVALGRMQAGRFLGEVPVDRGIKLAIMQAIASLEFLPGQHGKGKGLVPARIRDAARYWLAHRISPSVSIPDASGTS